MVIYKYPLRCPQDDFDLTLPRDAKILTVQIQEGVPCLWAAVDLEKPSVRRFFRIVGTGMDYDALGLDYIGTFQLPPYVWHLFEVV